MYQLCVSSLAKLSVALKIGKLAQECSKYASDLSSDFSTKGLLFMEFLVKTFNPALTFKKAIFKSGIRTHITTYSNKVLCDEQFRNAAKDLLRRMQVCDESVLNFFLGCFILQFSKDLLLFICKSMRGPSMPPPPVQQKRSKDDYSSDNFKQVVHYIGGAIVFSLLKTERRLNTVNPMYSVIREKFIEDENEESTLCPASIREWTAARDRGGLKYISRNCFDFLYCLFPFVMEFEEEDGSVIISKVTEGVKNRIDMLLQWEFLVGIEIEENEALEWLFTFIDISCRIISKGILKRRLNEERRQATSSVSLRQRVAN